MDLPSVSSYHSKDHKARGRGDSIVVLDPLRCCVLQPHHYELFSSNTWSALEGYFLEFMKDPRTNVTNTDEHGGPG